MDKVHDIIAKEEEEDRISNLPVDIIHCILSFLDMKYAVQTSTLSKNWKHIWTSLPNLNLDSRTFPTLPRFTKFVNNALSCRNHHTEVSTLELKVYGIVIWKKFSVKKIVKYAYLHNVRQMSIMWARWSGKFLELPQCIFSSHTLKHLTLATNQLYSYPSGQSVPKSAWDFPVLETLNLSYVKFGDSRRDSSVNPFFNCVKLKDLTLHGCAMFGLDIFTVSAPQLSSLTITDPDGFPKVFNIVAPQLENLMAPVNCKRRAGPEFYFLQLSTEGLNSLEKVNLSLSDDSYDNEGYVPQILGLFKKLCSAKFLILDKGIIEALSSCPDQLLDEPCPFNNLKSLKQMDCKETIPTHLRNYFLESSPNATFIMDLSTQVRKKLAKMIDTNQQRADVIKRELRDEEEYVPYPH